MMFVTIIVHNHVVNKLYSWKESIFHCWLPVVICLVLRENLNEGIWHGSHQLWFQSHIQLNMQVTWWLHRDISENMWDISTLWFTIGVTETHTLRRRGYWWEGLIEARIKGDVNVPISFFILQPTVRFSLFIALTKLICTVSHDSSLTLAPYMWWSTPRCAWFPLKYTLAE